jgi:hypothetical protein
MTVRRTYNGFHVRKFLEVKTQLGNRVYPLIGL